MKIIKLKTITIHDLIFTLILCGLSFLSDFTEQLIGIFLTSFYWRTLFNYNFSKEENSKQ